MTATTIWIIGVLAIAASIILWERYLAKGKAYRRGYRAAKSTPGYSTARSIVKRELKYAREEEIRQTDIFKQMEKRAKRHLQSGSQARYELHEAKRRLLSLKDELRDEQKGYEDLANEVKDHYPDFANHLGLFTQEEWDAIRLDRLEDAVDWNDTRLAMHREDIDNLTTISSML